MKRGKFFWVILAIALILLAVLYYFVFKARYYPVEAVDDVLGVNDDSVINSGVLSNDSVEVEDSVSDNVSVSEGGSESESSGSSGVIAPPPMMPTEDFG